jgi:hypothetical protein
VGLFGTVSGRFQPDFRNLRLAHASFAVSRHADGGAGELEASEEINIMTMFMFKSVTVAAIACAALTLAPAGGAAHSWYPHDCCHDQDCMPADAVETDKHGDWSVRVGSLRIWVPKIFEVRASPDQRAHICYRLDKEFGYMPLCLFLPTGS